MKILLDTSYLLPIIGISVKDLPRDAIIRLAEKGYEISLSEISLFELTANGAKYVTNGRLSAQRVCRGINAIIHDDRIRVIRIYDTPILMTAFKLRKFLNNFIDCLILSSAINNTDALITEDEPIHELEEEVKTFKHNLRIHKLNEILQ